MVSSEKYETVQVHIPHSVCAEADVTGLLGNAKLVNITSLVKQTEGMPDIVMPIMTYAALERSVPDAKIEPFLRFATGLMMRSLQEQAALNDGMIDHSVVWQEVYPGSWFVLQLVTDFRTEKRIFILGYSDDLQALGISAPARERPN